MRSFFEEIQLTDSENIQTRGFCGTFQFTWTSPRLKRLQQGLWGSEQLQFQFQSEEWTIKLSWKTYRNYNWNVHFRFQHAFHRETQYQALQQHQTDFLSEIAATIQEVLVHSMLLQFNLITESVKLKPQYFLLPFKMNLSLGLPRLILRRFPLRFLGPVKQNRFVNASNLYVLLFLVCLKSNDPVPFSLQHFKFSFFPPGMFNNTRLKNIHLT